MYRSANTRERQRAISSAARGDGSRGILAAQYAIVVPPTPALDPDGQFDLALDGNRLRLEQDDNTLAHVCYFPVPVTALQPNFGDETQMRALARDDYGLLTLRFRRIVARVKGNGHVALPANMPRVRLLHSSGALVTATDSSANFGAYNVEHNIEAHFAGDVARVSPTPYMIEFRGHFGTGSAGLYLYNFVIDLELDLGPRSWV
jgi:hypothetical protein